MGSSERAGVGAFGAVSKLFSMTAKTFVSLCVFGKGAGGGVEIRGIAVFALGEVDGKSDFTEIFEHISEV
jgi:hypothetical protein